MIVFFFLLGLLFGSFYTVVGLRLSKNESIVSPRSHCTNCNHILKWYELIPILSYIFLRGRCKNCKTKISIMYPAIELFTAVLFSVCFYKYGFSLELILGLLLSSLFIIVTVSDLNYYIIPDVIIIVFGILIFIYNIITKGFVDACVYIIYGIMIFLLMYLLMIFGNAVFKEESLGGGDIKLMGILGMIHKPIISVTSLALASLIALPVSIFFLKKNKDRIIPFGPFLVAALLIITLTELNTDTIVNFLTNK